MVVVKRVPEIKVSYKTQREYERYTITSSSHAFEILTTLYDWSEIELRESFYTLYLNRANHVLGFTKNGIGSTAGVVVDIKQILATACKTNSSSCLISHNHCSGNLKPSSQDIALTKKIIEAGKFLDVTIFDHIILTPDSRYFSFADEGMMY